uniref:Uncharacterized protein n=1 Tax=Cucumis melo TaxID=3656 RepID=A0A9I9EBR3_CUCME
MEINGRNPNLNGNRNHSSGDSKVFLNGKSKEIHSSTTIYKQNILVNVNEITWHERREWVGDCSEDVQRESMEPILSSVLSV